MEYFPKEVMRSWTIFFGIYNSQGYLPVGSVFLQYLGNRSYYTFKYRFDYLFVDFFECDEVNEEKNPGGIQQ